MPAFHLVLGLFAEGATDERFLPVLIQRTAERILAEKGVKVVEVLPPFVLKSKSAPIQSDRILEAAQRAAGFHALIIHADADGSTRDKAFRERFRPGYERVEQMKAEAPGSVCDQLLPIIPVQMVEAGLLAHPEALCRVLRTPKTAVELNLPTKANQIEADANPKRTLKFAVQKARSHLPRRRREIDLGTLFEPIARLVSLERLDEVPAYRQFVADLTATLYQLSLIK